LNHKISNRIFSTGFALPIIFIVSFTIITIVATDENQLMNSTSYSFAAAVSDRNIMTTSTINFFKTSLQSSSQHDFIINSSSFNESISSSSLSQSNSSSNKIKMPQLTDSNLTVEVVVDGLNMPTTMAFLGKDDFLVLQKNGSLVRVIDGVVSDKTRLIVPLAKGFYQGLLGIAITNQSIPTKNNETYVVLYYTEVSITNNNTNINEISTRDGNSR
jgi:glucose/arabinose dehydrogenase